MNSGFETFHRMQMRRQAGDPADELRESHQELLDLLLLIHTSYGVPVELARKVDVATERAEQISKKA